MARSELSEVERRFLLDPPASLARIATVDTDGMPHVVPGGWSFDETTQEVVLGGRDVPRTVRASHVRANGRAAVVIDGLAPGSGWSPWAFIVRGRARVDEQNGTIRVALNDLNSWGLPSIVSTSNTSSTHSPPKRSQGGAQSR